LGDGETDSARGGGDERDLALDPEIHSFTHASDVLPPTAFNDGPPVTPRPSATVLLIRDGNPWEVLMVQRPGGADFAPGAYVFPGGAVSDEDRASGDELRAAAVRELFEEAGIVIERDALAIFARWITPARLRRRFDTRFYLAMMPEGQSVRPQPGEIVDWLWLAPTQALQRADITLVYATRAVLESVADAPDAPSLLARARELREVPVVEPRLVQTASGWEIVRD